MRSLMIENFEIFKGNQSEENKLTYYNIYLFTYYINFVVLSWAIYPMYNIPSKKDF